jgi:hypothetical protein
VDVGGDAALPVGCINSARGAISRKNRVGFRNCVGVREFSRLSPRPG